MSGHPQPGQYDDGGGYGQHPQGTDSYYHDDHQQPYYDHQQPGYGQQPQGTDSYYDES